MQRDRFQPYPSPTLTAKNLAAVAARADPPLDDAQPDAMTVPVPDTDSEDDKHDAAGDMFAAFENLAMRDPWVPVPLGCQRASGSEWEPSGHRWTHSIGKLKWIEDEDGQCWWDGWSEKSWGQYWDADAWNNWRATDTSWAAAGTVASEHTHGKPISGAGSINDDVEEPSSSSHDWGWATTYKRVRSRSPARQH